MIWQCPDVFTFCKCVSWCLSVILECTLPFSPLVLLLNDDSLLRLSFQPRRVWLAGLTAAKEHCHIMLAGPTVSPETTVATFFFGPSLHGTVDSKTTHCKTKELDCCRQRRRKCKNTTLMYYLYASPVGSSCVSCLCCLYVCNIM